MGLSTTGGGPKGPRGPEEEYQAGVKQLQSHDWLDAQRTLDQVRTRYPYSRFAALAELRLANGKFDQDKFVEAAEAYQQFVKLHPNHEEVDYASYRVGLSRWKDAPSGFFLLPPVYERDMTPVVAAITALEAFLKSYPKSKYVPEAEKLMAEAKGLFVERDWYVAGFYRNRDRWESVAFRMEHLLKEYPGSRYESRALYQLAEASRPIFLGFCFTPDYRSHFAGGASRVAMPWRGGHVPPVALPFRVPFTSRIGGVRCERSAQSGRMTT